MRKLLALLVGGPDRFATGASRDRCITRQANLATGNGEWLNLFALDAFENIALKIARATEKTILRTSQQDPIFNLQFHQMQRTDKVSQLKQSIFRWAHILKKFNRKAQIFSDILPRIK